MIYFMCTYECLPCICMCLLSPEEGTRFPEYGVTGGYCLMWLLGTELRSSVRITSECFLTSEPSLQHQERHFTLPLKY